MTLTYTADFCVGSYLPYDVPTYAATSSKGNRLNLFYPKAPNVMPADGWPLLIVYNGVGFTASAIPGAAFSPNTGVEWQALGHGIAVASVQITPSGANSNTLGGKGFFHPPGSLSRRWEDPTFRMGEKDALYAMQNLRYYAGTYQINGNKIGVYGDSAGGHMAAWVALNEDFARRLGSGGQYDMPTKPSTGMITNFVAAYWKFYTQTLNGSTVAAHFSGPTGLETAAADLTSTIGGYQDAASVFNWIRSHGREENIHMLLFSPDPHVSNDLSQPFPSAGETQLHSAWNGALIKAFNPKTTRFGIHTTDVTASDWAGLTDFITTKVQSDGSDVTTNASNNELVSFLIAHIGDRPGVPQSGEKVTTPMPVIVKTYGEASWINGAVGTDGLQVLGRDPYRTRCELQNVGTNTNLRFGPNYDNAKGVLEPALSGGGIPWVSGSKTEIFGTGPLYLRADTTVAYYNIQEVF